MEDYFKKYYSIDSPMLWRITLNGVCCFDEKCTINTMKDCLGLILRQLIGLDLCTIRIDCLQGELIEQSHYPSLLNAGLR
jgi:hypothetical protein